MAVHIIAVGSHHSIFSLKSSVTPEAAKATPVDPDPLRPRVEFVGSSVINKLEQHRALAEQQTCLQNAASVAHLPFDPTAIKNCGYLAKVKLGLAYKSSPDSDDDFQGESSGLSYGLSLALLCAKHSGMYDYEGVRDMLVFATGRLPQGNGSVLAIDNLQAKLKAVCDYMKTDKHKREFYFFYPKGNALSPALDGTSDADAVEASWKALLQRATRLNGKVIEVSTLKEAVAELLGEHLITTIDSDETFPGIKPILWLDRHLYRGRENVITELEHKARLSYQSNNILVVEGPSGSGKSSVVLGGMAARLVHPKELSSTDAADNQLSHTRFREPHRITPASYDNLAELLKGLLSNITDDEAVLTQWLDSDTPAELTQQIKAYLNAQAEPDKRPFLWVIDQAEELFTHSPYPQGIANTLCEYLTALAAELDVLIISIHRIEYQSRILWRKNNPDHLATVDTPEPSEMVDLIEQHITARGLILELTTDAQPKTLRQRIVDDINRMPLTTVGTLLQQMNELKKHDELPREVLRHTYYDAVGQAQGAMAHLATTALQHADKNYRDHNRNAEDEQIHTLHHCLFELFVGVDEDGSPITLAPSKQQINYYTIANDLWRYIDIFRNHGLIVEYGWGNIPRYKFAHDTLISGINQYDGSAEHTQHTWAILGQWWVDNTEYLRWRRSIQNLLEFWIDQQANQKSDTAKAGKSKEESAKKSIITYLNDSQIHQAVHHQSQGHIQYKALGQFIEQSKYEQTQRTKKRNRLLVGGITAMATLLAISTVLAAVAYNYYQRSDALLTSLTSNINFLNFELRDAVKNLPSNQRIPIMEQVQSLTNALDAHGDDSTLQRRQRAIALVQKADLILETDQLDIGEAMPLLQEAHELFLRNAAQAPSNVDFQSDLSVSHNHLANLHLRNGDIDQALAGYQAGMEIDQALSDKYPNNLDLQRSLSVSSRSLADLHLRSGEVNQALVGYETSMVISQALVDKSPNNLLFQEDLSDSHDKLADLHLVKGEYALAFAGYQAAMAIRQALVDKDPKNLDYQWLLAVSYGRLGDLSLERGDSAQTAASYQAAIDISQALIESDPNIIKFQRDLAVVTSKLANLHLSKGAVVRALAGFQSALAIHQALVNKDPDNLLFKEDLSRSYGNLSDLHLRNGDIDQAMEGYGAMVEIHQALVEKDPNNLQFQSDLALSTEYLADLHLRTGDIDQAREGYEATVEIHKALVNKYRNTLEFQNDLAVSHLKLADLYLRNGDIAKALAGYQAATAIGQTLADKAPGNINYQWLLSVLHVDLGDLHLRYGEVDQAVAQYQAAMVIHQELFNKDPNVLNIQSGLLVSHSKLADAYLQRGEIDQALTGYQSALNIAQALIDKDPKNAQFQEYLSMSLDRLADIHLRSGDSDEALARYQASMAIDQALAKNEPNNLRFQRGLLVSHEKLADLYMRIDDTEQALVGYQAMMKISQALVDKDPNNLQFQRSLSVSHERLADLHLRNGDTNQAREGYQAALDLWQVLIHKDPNNLEFQRGLVVLFYNLGEVSLTTGQQQQASNYWSEAKAEAQKLIDKAPKNPDYQSLYRGISSRLLSL